MSRQRPYTDRRTYLKIIGTGAIVGIAGCQGTDRTEGANHEAPHPDDENVPDEYVGVESLGGKSRPEEPAQEKHSVSFDHTPQDGAYCGTCKFFVPDQNGDEFGACTDVKGKIHPCDSCGRFEAYEGSDAVSCEEA